MINLFFIIAITGCILVIAMLVINDYKKSIDNCKDHIEDIIQYSWEDEMKHFQETYEIATIDSNDDLNTWIKWCEENNATDHIFYHLMCVRQEMDL